MKQFFSQAKQEADELAKDQESFNIRRLKDVEPSQMGQIQQSNRYWIEYLAKLKGMTSQQYLQEEGQQYNLVLGENNVWQQMYSTNEAMLFTLQDILETEEKQLEGMWNIPSGATFWVPLQSMFYQDKGGGGFPELPELLPPTQRTATATEETAMSSAESARALAHVVDLMSLREMEEKIARTEKSPAEVRRDMAHVVDLQSLRDMETALSRKYGDVGPSSKEVAAVNVTVPQILVEAAITLQNTMTIDSRVIQMEVSRHLQKLLTKSIRSSGKNTIGQNR